VVEIDLKLEDKDY